MVWGNKDEFLIVTSVDGTLQQFPVAPAANNVEEKLPKKTSSKLTTLLYNETAGAILAAGGEGSKGIVMEYFDNE